MLEVLLPAATQGDDQVWLLLLQLLLLMQTAVASVAVAVFKAVAVTVAIRMPCHAGGTAAIHTTR